MPFIQQTESQTSKESTVSKGIKHRESKSYQNQQTRIHTLQQHLKEK